MNGTDEYRMGFECGRRAAPAYAISQLNFQQGETNKVFGVNNNYGYDNYGCWGYKLGSRF